MYMYSVFTCAAICFYSAYLYNDEGELLREHHDYNNNIGLQAKHQVIDHFLYGIHPDKHRSVLKVSFEKEVDPSLQNVLNKG